MKAIICAIVLMASFSVASDKYKVEDAVGDLSREECIKIYMDKHGLGRTTAEQECDEYDGNDEPDDFSEELEDPVGNSYDEGYAEGYADSSISAWLEESVGKSKKMKKCTLTGGEKVKHGWHGKDTGNNSCNTCSCKNGNLACSKVGCDAKLPPKLKGCTLTGGKSVKHGYNGKDGGTNFCNTCDCVDGILSCTKILCILEPPVEPELDTCQCVDVNAPKDKSIKFLCERELKSKRMEGFTCSPALVDRKGDYFCPTPKARKKSKYPRVTPKLCLRDTSGKTGLNLNRRKWKKAHKPLLLKKKKLRLKSALKVEMARKKLLTVRQEGPGAEEAVGSSNTRIYIGGLDGDCSEKELEREFEFFGIIKDIWVAANPPGFGFITYENEADAAEAVNDMNGQRVCGFKITVSLASKALPGADRKSIDDIDHNIEVIKKELEALNIQTQDSIDILPKKHAPTEPEVCTCAIENRPKTGDDFFCQKTNSGKRAPAVPQCRPVNSNDGTCKDPKKKGWTLCVNDHHPVHGFSTKHSDYKKKMVSTLKHVEDQGRGVQKLEKKTKEVVKQKAKLTRKSGNTRIYFGGLPSHCSKSQVEEDYEYFGDLKDVTVYLDGTGFIVFENPEDAANAIEKLEGRIFCGSKIHVSYDRFKSRSGYFVTYKNKDLNAPDYKVGKYDCYSETCVLEEVLEKLHEIETIADCADLCVANEKCLGFEYYTNHNQVKKGKAKDCTLKSSTDMSECDGAIQNTDFCVEGEEESKEPDYYANDYPCYKKKCTIAQNFKKIENIATKEECAAECDKRERCVAIEHWTDYGSWRIVYKEGDCLLNYSADMKGCRGHLWNMEVCLKPAKKEPFYEVRNYDCYSASCVNGGTLAEMHTHDIEDCSQECENNPSCVGFEYYTNHGKSKKGKSNTCTLKSITEMTGCDGVEENTDFCVAGEEMEDPSPDYYVGAYPCFEKHCTIKQNFKKVKNIATKAECAAECDKRKKCVAFEHWTDYGSWRTVYEEGDCLLNYAADMKGCRGHLWNMEVCLKPVPEPEPVVKKGKSISECQHSSEPITTTCWCGRGEESQTICTKGEFCYYDKCVKSIGAGKARSSSTPEFNSIWISGLKSCTNIILQDAFIIFGEITDIWCLPSDGIVTYSKASAAKMAQDKMNGATVYGSTITVSPLVEDAIGDQTPKFTSIWVSGLKFCENNKLQGVFENYGEITDIWCALLTDAMITYSRASEAKLALEEMNGKTISGSTISVSPISEDAVGDEVANDQGYQHYNGMDIARGNQIIALDDIVYNNGKLYQCGMPELCVLNPYYYAPGTGTRWRNAWTKLEGHASELSENSEASVASSTLSLTANKGTITSHSKNKDGESCKYLVLERESECDWNGVDSRNRYSLDNPSTSKQCLNKCDEFGEKCQYMAWVQSDWGRNYCHLFEDCKGNGGGRWWMGRKVCGDDIPQYASDTESQVGQYGGMLVQDSESQVGQYGGMLVQDSESQVGGFVVQDEAALGNADESVEISVAGWFKDLRKDIEMVDEKIIDDVENEEKDMHRAMNKERNRFKKYVNNHGEMPLAESPPIIEPPIIEPPTIDFDCKCNRKMRPVCGKDGKNYNNKCLAKCAGTTVNYKGFCKDKEACKCNRKMRPVCGKDGKNYNNKCLAKCAGTTVDYKGFCKILGSVVIDDYFKSKSEGQREPIKRVRFDEESVGAQSGSNHTSYVTLAGIGLGTLALGFAFGKWREHKNKNKYQLLHDAIEMQ